MDQKDDWGTNVLLGIIGSVLAFVALADIVGRLSRLFIQEWPFISWGMAILSSGLTLVWLSVKLHNALAAHASEVGQKLDFNENRLRGMEGQVERHEKRITELKQEVIEYRRDCWDFIKRLDEVAAQKGPAQSVAEKSPDAIQAAANEIVGGAA